MSYIPLSLSPEMTLCFPQVDDRLPILKMTSTRERLIWAKDLIEGVASEGGTRGCMIM